MKPNKGYLSALTIGFGIYIVVSASFARQLWELFSALLGEENLKLVCVIMIFLLGTAIILYIARLRLNPIRLIAGVILLAFSFWYAGRQSYFVKQVHTVEYNILGLLAMRDSRKLFFAFLFVLLIAALDEGLQKLLPYRTGDLPDVITDCIGGLAGIFLFLLASSGRVKGDVLK